MPTATDPIMMPTMAPQLATVDPQPRCLSPTQSMTRADTALMPKPAERPWTKRAASTAAPLSAIMNMMQPTMASMRVRLVTGVRPKASEMRPSSKSVKATPVR